MFYKFSVKIIPNHFFIQFLQIDLYKLVIRILRAKYKLGLAPATIAKLFSESYGIPLPLPVTSGTQRHHEGERAVIPEQSRHPIVPTPTASVSSASARPPLLRTHDGATESGTIVRCSLPTLN